MSNHLQDRRADMHRGKDDSSKFGVKNLIIGGVLVAVIAAILVLA